MRGAEALVRWLHPQHGVLGPDRFIPLAEHTGLIVPLGRWVLEQSVRQAREWRELHGWWCGAVGPLRINVNLSPCQLTHPGPGPGHRRHPGTHRHRNRTRSAWRSPSRR
ncbi:hypothetical protein GCM10011428_01420 [Streptomyces violaceus]